MKFKDKMNGDVGVLTCKGKMMGFPETDDLHGEIRSFLGQGVKKIVVDLSGISWMNSMGVGALMRCLTTARNHKADMCLIGLTDKVRSIFVMTQLVRVFNIYESEKQAVESFNKK